MKLNDLVVKFDSLEEKLIGLEFELDAKNAELQEMARVGTMITSILELDRVLSAMMDMSLRLLRAEVGCILLWNDNGELETRVSWGVDHSLVKQLKMDGDQDVAQWIKDSGETVIINDFPPDISVPAEINSVISAPLNCREETIGILVALNKTDDDGFNENDKSTLETLVSFATVAIENSKLLEEQLIKQKLENELMLANEVQQALLPTDEFNFKGASISNIYYPAGEVGGDYYDIIPISSRKFVVILGDVSNKGVPAALMMTAARSVVRHEVRRLTDVASIMDNINLTLCRDIMLRDGMFISLIFALFDLDEMKMTISNAGHLPPLLFNPERDEIVELKKGGVIFGQFEECRYIAETVDIHAGDRLLCFTDGITESMDLQDNMFGRDGLKEFTARHKKVDDEKFLNLLKSDIDEFVKGTGPVQFDDITCVLVGINGK
jgi:phosphoserine phosphatase RsbU/P